MFGVCCLALACGGFLHGEVCIIPQPSKVVETAGAFELREGAKVRLNLAPVDDLLLPRLREFVHQDEPTTRLAMVE